MSEIKREIGQFPVTVFRFMVLIALYISIALKDDAIFGLLGNL